MAETAFNPEFDVEFRRFVPVPRQLMWRCWTEPELLVKWFCPKPWYVSEAIVDLRPGGRFFSRMRGPEGQDMPNEGCFLDLETNTRLVWTDTLGPGFRPRETGFFTGLVTFADAEGGTNYYARAMHKTAKDRETHEKMGFEQGWGAALDQMVALIKSELM